MKVGCWVRAGLNSCLAAAVCWCFKGWMAEGGEEEEGQQASGSRTGTGDCIENKRRERERDREKVGKEERKGRER